MLRINSVGTTSVCDPASIFACPQCGMHHPVYMRYLWLTCWQLFAFTGQMNTTLSVQREISTAKRSKHEQILRQNLIKVKSFATQCNTTQHHATSCNIMQHHATSCNIMQHHATSCNIMQQGGQTTAARPHNKVVWHCYNGLTRPTVLLQWRVYEWVNIIPLPMPK